MLRDLISKIEFEVDSKTSMQELGRSRLEKQVARLEKSAAGRTDDAELRVRMKARAVDTLESEMVVLRNQFEECHNLAKAMKRESHRFVDYHSMERRLETAAPLNARVSVLALPTATCHRNSAFCLLWSCAAGAAVLLTSAVVGADTLRSDRG